MIVQRPPNRARSGPRRRAAILAAACAALLALLAAPGIGRAAEPAVGPLVRDLGATETDALVRTIVALGARGDAAALPALEALYDDRLRVARDGAVYVVDAATKRLVDPLTGAEIPAPPAGLRAGEMNNELRRALLPVLAQLRLGAPDRKVRLAAADELAKRGDPGAEALLRRAVAAESDGAVKAALSLGLARIDLHHADPARRLAALAVVEDLGSGSARGELEALTRQRPDGSWAEPDARVRAAAADALAAIGRREQTVALFGHLVYGVSLASVFLFAALGLAITFGVMGVINMAHGEMLTIGAYCAYVVQVVCAQHAPALLPYYVLLALPVAFVVAGAVGVGLERTVIRRLYGRPLETLLATWGISLVLVQTIRLLFGATNVAVANPPWLDGGWQLAQGLVLPYNRLAVVVFVVLAALFVWALLQKTSLGLQVRAVTQNRHMAACMGVRTARVDMWTFGLGSGLAGLGGVALSQLGNVGPQLGQGYILDAFMVVVLGGVGRIAGTIGAALGIGIVQKLLEPMSGAVLGKIAVLVFIILFIQRRPQGMFAPRGRVEA
jgi:urea transport system permease protein